MSCNREGRGGDHFRRKEDFDDGVGGVEADGADEEAVDALKGGLVCYGGQLCDKCLKGGTERKKGHF